MAPLETIHEMQLAIYVLDASSQIDLAVLYLSNSIVELRM